MADMTPERAQECLEVWGDSLGEVTFNDIRSAFHTLANMRVEHDHGPVPWEQVDGRYEVYHRVRLVGEWRDT